jgi:7-cyano-7-deazaguanine reductase
MPNLDRSPLGKPTANPAHYDPALLFSIERAAQRSTLALDAGLPFTGIDIWTSYEITWLDRRGRPQVAVGEFRVAADSPAIVEAKSLKLYLSSFAQERVGVAAEMARIIEADLARACSAPVGVALLPAPGALRVAELPGVSLDDLDVACDSFQPDPALLTRGAGVAEEALRTALFRSTCPVTGQPDYGDVLVRYRGPRIDRGALLKYLVSYRQHAAFHEACVERIFVDIARRCRTEKLTVYARFLRRGGLDINPFRSDFETAPRSERTPRQ